MSDSVPQSGASRWPVFLVIGLLVTVTVVFLIEFAISTRDEIAARSQPVAEPIVDENAVAALLDGADPAAGAKLVELYGCVACHRIGVRSKIAPSFENVAEVAGMRHPPLSAEAYIYESITNPTAFVVEGFNPAMPQNFKDRLSSREIGDIIAYLLSPGAN